MEIPGISRDFCYIWSMKHIKTETVVTTTEEYVCDICDQSISDYELAQLSRAGETSLVTGTCVQYGYQLTLGCGYKRINHVCRRCLKEILEHITSTI